MSQADKTSLKKFVKRCSKVVDREIRLLRKWEANANSSKRKTRCALWRGRIEDGPRATMDAVETAVDALPAADVTRPPSALHDAMLQDHESSISSREHLNVNSLSNDEFSLALEMALLNARGVANLGKRALSHCTKSD
jgi:hypothetical protein